MALAQADAVVDKPADPVLEASAQDNIARSGKYYAGPRDWQVYFFFRILTEIEVNQALRPPAPAAEAFESGNASAKLVAANATKFGLELLNPGLFSLPKVKGAEKSSPFESSAHYTPPAKEFRDWLRRISGGGGGDDPATTLFAKLTAASPSPAPAAVQAQKPGKGAKALAVAPAKLEAPTPEKLSSLPAAAEALAAISQNTKALDSKDAIPATGAEVVRQGLLAVVLYELLRQQSLTGSGGALRAGGGGGLESADSPPAPQPSAGPAPLYFDPATINIAFTHNGLKQLLLDATILRSFPDAFQDGMAARAARLCDTGASSPENWYGELGSGRIHGYFTGGFAADGVAADAWKSLRKQIDQFNTRRPDAAPLRVALQKIFVPFGMELMHIEIGQAPYNVDDAGGTKAISPRIEHFGFRDGISQPFLDMKLSPDGQMRPPAQGGATPGRNRTWTPLAAGEVYLGYPDEDGNYVEQPANRTLRTAGTYIVFRKLAQDVVGFRNFLKAQRPHSTAEQDYLAAQIVGRWKGGASLVVAPKTELKGDDERLNDFRYTDQDPVGAKCPLGAHVRRANPRDIGGRNDVRRHRLMRRSMAYGGSVLSEESIGDEEERGLLFVAANSRLDMQFEVIQGDWLNRGEFLGQAGLGKCPLTGTSNSSVHDSFLEAGRGAPVTGLPNFVTLRGGDYFFAPSVDAVRGLADAKTTFPPEDESLVAHGHSFGDGCTEELFSEERLTPLVTQVLAGVKTAIGYRLPPAAYGQQSYGGARPLEPDYVPRDIVFVRSHADVSAVLNSRPAPGKDLEYTAAHSRIAGQRMLGRGNLLVGTDWGHPTAAERQILFDILDAAWNPDRAYWVSQLSAIVNRSLRDATARVAPAGRIDLIRDFAADATFRVVTDLFGVTSPDHLTELAMAIPFSRRHVGQVHPDWLQTYSGGADDNPGLVTLKVWSFLVGLNLVGDFKLQKQVIVLGQQAAGEALLHIDMLIARARERRPNTPKTLLSAFINAEAPFLKTHPAILPEQYYTHVRALLFELALTASAVIPSVFGKVMNASFDFGIDLSQLVPHLEYASTLPHSTGPNDGVERLIYEINRLDPALPVVMRLCEVQPAGTLQSGAQIQKGQWVAALVAGANFDGAVFSQPDKFSLSPLLPGGPARDRAKYLMFGVQDPTIPPGTAASTRTCWGRDRIALFTLTECMRAASKLPGLRRVPGPPGELKKFLGIASSLKARFAPFTPE